MSSVRLVYHPENVLALVNKQGGGIERRTNKHANDLVSIAKKLVNVPAPRPWGSQINETTIPWRRYGRLRDGIVKAAAPPSAAGLTGYVVATTVETEGGYAYGAALETGINLPFHVTHKFPYLVPSLKLLRQQIK